MLAGVRTHALHTCKCQRGYSRPVAVCPRPRWKRIGGQAVLVDSHASSPVACISLRSPGPVSGGMVRIIRQASFKMISRGTAAISLPHLEHTASKIERREAALTNTTLDS